MPLGMRLDTNKNAGFFAGVFIFALAFACVRHIFERSIDNATGEY